MQFTDYTIMSFGKYKHTPLFEVPLSYLIWYKEEQEKNPTWHPDKKDLLEYIEKRIKQPELKDRLKSEIMGCLPSEYINDSITAGRIANDILDVLKKFNLLK